MARPRKKTWAGYKQDDVDRLYRRIEECQSVIDHLSACPAWAVIIKDLKDQMSDIDSRWHLIVEEEKLMHARYIKYAYMHLIDIVAKYSLDKENAEKEVALLTSQTENIIKDYDTETNLEP